jgi:hypothetical protein
MVYISEIPLLTQKGKGGGGGGCWAREVTHMGMGGATSLPLCMGVGISSTSTPSVHEGIGKMPPIL